MAKGQRGRSHVLTAAQRDEVARRYIAGERSADLSRAFGVDPVAITGIAVRRGARPHGKRRRPLNERAFAEFGPDRNYWVGFLMADGSVRGAPFNSVTLTLAEQDRDHVRKFRDFLSSGHKLATVKPSGKNRNTYARICVSSRTIIYDLQLLNVVENKTFITRAPDSLLLDRDFWRGAIDGDGWIFTKQNCPRMGLKGSQTIIEQFAEFAAYATGRSTRVFVKPDRNVWMAATQGEYARNIIEVLYGGQPTTFLERKYQKAKEALSTKPRWPSQKHTVPLAFRFVG